jgi:hypothetical protein
MWSFVCVRMRKTSCGGVGDVITPRYIGID